MYSDELLFPDKFYYLTDSANRDTVFMQGVQINRVDNPVLLMRNIQFIYAMPEALGCTRGCMYSVFYLQNRCNLPWFIDYNGITELIESKY
jgi:hypothetical protein